MSKYMFKLIPKFRIIFIKNTAQKKNYILNEDENQKKLIN